MLSIGERLAESGASVAVVTNDQGEFLVDTAYARSRGVTANEVLGGCFCCNFGELTSILKDLKDTVKPDFILAEPVGSCTDLAATVIGPLSLYNEELVSLGAYLVLADGDRMAGEYQKLNLENPVSPREVLISHQLRESLKIILSKNDLLSETDRVKALERLGRLVPDAEILPCSVSTGEGLDRVMEWVKDPSAPVLPKPVDLDYEVYARAEAELGWYNGITTLRSTDGFSPEDVALDIITGIKKELGYDAAHAKLLLGSDSGSIKTSLSGGRLQADTALSPGTEVRQLGLTLNIRALRTPQELESLSRRMIDMVIEGYNLKESGYQSESLIPGEPKPTHRLSC